MAASQYYSDKDARCESLLKALRSAAAGPRQAGGGGGGEGAGALPEAIQDCAVTAGWVHRMPLQRELLRAAIYGRSHAPDAADAALIPLCSLHVRLLNSLRRPSKVWGLSMPTGASAIPCNGARVRACMAGLGSRATCMPLTMPLSN